MLVDGHRPAVAVNAREDSLDDSNSHRGKQLFDGSLTPRQVARVRISEAQHDPTVGQGLHTSRMISARKRDDEVVLRKLHDLDARRLLRADTAPPGHLLSSKRSHEVIIKLEHVKRYRPLSVIELEVDFERRPTVFGIHD